MLAARAFAADAWEDAEVEGTDVRLSYYGSACQDDAWVEIKEDAETVVLTISTATDAGSCVSLGVGYTIDARLDRPLADRRLVDGAR